MDNFNLKKYLAEGRIHLTENDQDYWPEWAAGEIKVGNNNVGVEFGDADDEAMGVFKDYVKAVKFLNADSKELRNDIATAVSSISFLGGDFEDSEFNILTPAQFSKIKNVINADVSEGKLHENSYEVQEDQAEMFIRIHDILNKGGHDEERADLASFIRDTFNGEGGNEEMLRGMGFTEV